VKICVKPYSLPYVQFFNSSQRPKVQKEMLFPSNFLCSLGIKFVMYYVKSMDAPQSQVLGLLALLVKVSIVRGFIWSHQVPSFEF